MAATVRGTPRKRAAVAARRFGYIVAIVINVAFIVIANNLVEWNWFSFLTPDFSSVVWLLNLSFAVSIAANALYIVDDSRRPKAAGQLVTNLISVVVSVRMLQVFPFDFSGWGTNWSWLFRLALIVAIGGAAIGAVAELVKLARPAAERASAA
jgi:hypothetical protein